MKIEEIISRFEKLANPESLPGMARFGITPERAYGIRIPVLRSLAKEIGKDHDLAFELWARDTRETRILASLVADPEKVTSELMDEWVVEFDYWEICDQVIANLFEKSHFTDTKIDEWCDRPEEFVKRAGFVLIARMALKDKKRDDNLFVPYFDLIFREADDERNFVKKAVNWALRHLGKRSLYLNKLAIQEAERITLIDSKSASWIASDALRELKSEAVQQRLVAKQQKNAGT